MRILEEVQEELRQVNAAILAIVSGAQSYSTGSRSVTKVDLAQLRDLRDDLCAEINEIECGGCTAHLVGWPGR